MVNKSRFYVLNMHFPKQLLWFLWRLTIPFCCEDFIDQFFFLYETGCYYYTDINVKKFDVSKLLVAWWGGQLWGAMVLVHILLMFVVNLVSKLYLKILELNFVYIVIVWISSYLNLYNIIFIIFGFDIFD